MTTITTATELDALPAGSVVLDCENIAWQKEDDSDVPWTASGGWGETAEILLPATVLHVPGQPAPAVKPGREEIARALHGADLTTGLACEDYEDMNAEAIASYEAAADAVLALLPGRTEAEVKAEARGDLLREIWTADGGDDGTLSVESTVAWLRTRADELERGEGR